MEIYTQGLPDGTHTNQKYTFMIDGKHVTLPGNYIGPDQMGEPSYVEQVDWIKGLADTINIKEVWYGTWELGSNYELERFLNLLEPVKVGQNPEEDMNTYPMQLLAKLAEGYVLKILEDKESQLYSYWQQSNQDYIFYVKEGKKYFYTNSMDREQFKVMFEFEGTDTIDIIELAQEEWIIDAVRKLNEGQTLTISENTEGVVHHFRRCNDEAVVYHTYVDGSKTTGKYIGHKGMDLILHIYKPHQVGLLEK